MFFQSFTFSRINSNENRKQNTYIQKKLQKYAENFIFFKAWIKNPLLIGAVAPSSRYLSREMASHCDKNQSGLIIELGAGTGVFTQALLQSGISPDRLIVLEYCPALAKKLRGKFPTICIIEDNAMNLAQLLKNETRPVSAVVSGLPLRAFSSSVRNEILKQIRAVLAPQGKYIQFTYSFIKTRYSIFSEVQKIYSKRIWRNIPPARVDVWQVGFF